MIPFRTQWSLRDAVEIKIFDKPFQLDLPCPFEQAVCDLSLTGPQGTGAAITDTLTSIENLLGSSHDDVLKGGNDVLFGEAGADRFVFEHGSGGDVIGDFAHGEDTIDVSAFHFASFADLQSHFVQNGDDGAIDLGGGDFIVLQHTSMTSLDAADFVI